MIMIARPALARNLGCSRCLFADSDRVVRTPPQRNNLPCFAAFPTRAYKGFKYRTCS